MTYNSRTEMAKSSETAYREERTRLREQVKNADSEAERREAILRLAEINREIHADTCEKLARE